MRGQRSSPRRRGSKKRKSLWDSDDEDEIVMPAACFQSPPDQLGSIWKSPFIKKITTEDGKKNWHCFHCRQTFCGGHNAFKALMHVCQIPGHSIATCSGNPSPPWLLCYRNHQSECQARIDAKKARHDMFEMHRIAQDEKVLKLQLERKGIERKKPPPNPAFIVPPVASLSSASQDDLGRNNHLVSGQTMLTGYNADPHAGTIARNKLAHALMANAVPFTLVDDPAFRHAMNYFKTVDPKKWSWFSRNELAGPILDDLFVAQQEASYKTIKEGASVFGVTIMGDGATINKTPLLNIMAQSGQDYASQLEIVDCSSRMASGGTKDAYYIAETFHPHVIKVGKDLVHLCILDGASPAQKAGKLLSVDFPRITCVHDPCHANQLYFSDTGKLKPVNLMCRNYRRVYFWCMGPHHDLTANFLTCTAASNELGTGELRLIKLCTMRFACHLICFARHCRTKQATLTWLSFAETMKAGLPKLLKRMLQKDEYWRAHHMLCKFNGPLKLCLRWSDRKGPGMHMHHYLILRAEETMLGMMDEVNEVIFLEDDPRWQGSIFQDM